MLKMLQEEKIQLFWGIKRGRGNDFRILTEGGTLWTRSFFYYFSIMDNVAKKKLNIKRIVKEL